MTADPSKPAISTTGCLLRIGVALVAVLVVIGSAAAGYFLWDQQKHRKALAAEVQAIRDAGEPLDGADLNEFYRVPEGEADITAEWVEALAPFTGDAPLANSGQKLKPFLKWSESGLEPPHRPDEWPQLAELEEQLAPYREALAKIEEVGHKPGGVRYPIDMARGWVTQLPHGNACVSASRALQLQGLCHYHRGEMNRAADDVITQIRMAQTLRHEPFLVSQMMRMLTLRLAQELIIYSAADLDFPAAELERIQAALTTVDFTNLQLPVFLSERAGGYATYSQPYVTDPDVKRPVTEGTILINSRPGDSAAFLHWNARSIEAAKLPFRQAVAQAREVEKELLTAFSADQKLPGFMQNQVSQSDIIPPVHTLGILGRATTENRALQAFCAIERFRRKEQRLPESLLELVPDYLTEVPLDPYTEQPLMYLRLDDHYIVYGIGVNGQDDQGSVNYSPFRDNGVMSFYRRPVFDPDALMPTPMHARPVPPVGEPGAAPQE